MNLVPLASGIVQFRYVTPLVVHVVGLSDRDDSGKYEAYFDCRSYVIGILNEFPSGITPNMEGGYVVFPTCSEELPPAANWLSCMSCPATGSNSSATSRVANPPVTFDSREVGHVIVIFEHCGGYPSDVSVILNENEYNPRISSSDKKQDPLVG
jgi:hypothetical protein